MRIKPPLTTSNIKTIEDLVKYSSITFSSIIDAINGNLALSDNIRLEIQNVTFTQANVDTVVRHGLGYSPNGYIVVGNSSNVTIYDGLRPSTNDALYLRATGSTNAKILLF